MEALSDSVIDGRDFQLKNLLKANRKVSVDKPVTISKWIALVLTLVKRQMHALCSPTGSSTLSVQVKSTPVTANDLVDPADPTCVLRSGGGSGVL